MEKDDYNPSAEELLKASFEKADDEYMKFEKVSPKLSNRRDLHAFMRLDQWFPSDRFDDLISAAEHDEYYLDIPIDQLVTLTEDQVVELSRCGVQFDASLECLSLFA